MDIDNFKSYNDHYGHAAGDRALHKIGALLRRRFRKDDDLAFRIGGEEFIITLKTREAGDALVLFEALCGSIVAMALPHAGNPPHNVVTASFGMTQFHRPQNPFSLFKTADAALYVAKADGRNSISMDTSTGFRKVRVSTHSENDRGAKMLIWSEHVARHPEL